MFKQLHKDNKGFTIIEVLIVLAIAGLIMLIVFLAVPALQRNQRNNARNSDASRISASITECLANRNGQTSACTSGVLQFGTTTQLTGVSQSAAAATAPAGSTTAAQYQFAWTCTTNGDAPTQTGASSRDFALMFVLEPNITRCISS